MLWQQTFSELPSLWLLYFKSRHSRSSFSFVADEDLRGRKVLLLTSFCCVNWSDTSEKVGESLTLTLHAINRNSKTIILWIHLLTHSTQQSTQNVFPYNITHMLTKSQYTILCTYTHAVVSSIYNIINLRKQYHLFTIS